MNRIMYYDWIVIERITKKNYTTQSLKIFYFSFNKGNCYYYNLLSSSVITRFSASFSNIDHVLYFSQKILFITLYINLKIIKSRV